MPSMASRSTTPPTTPRTKSKAGSDKPPAGSRLTRDDWLDAAFRAAIDGGFGAVRVLTLADALGVTRGSFYWHFADHAELVHALIDRWYQRELTVGERLLQGHPPDPSSRILRILDGAIAHSVEEREFDRFELALRSLASKDNAVAELLEKVDQNRMQILHDHYFQLVHDEQKALELSALFYLAVVGSHQALNRPSASDKMSDYLKSIISRHLVHAVQPNA